MATRQRGGRDFGPTNTFCKPTQWAEERGQRGGEEGRWGGESTVRVKDVGGRRGKRGGGYKCNLRLIIIRLTLHRITRNSSSPPPPPPPLTPARGHTGSRVGRVKQRSWCLDFCIHCLVCKPQNHYQCQGQLVFHPMLSSCFGSSPRKGFLGIK